MIFVRKPIFGVEKRPQIHIVPKHIKVSNIAFFPLISDMLKKNGLMVDNDADLWALMCRNHKKIVVNQKIPQFSQKVSASNACMLATFSMSDYLVP